MISFTLLTTKHYFNCNIYPHFMICTLKSHGTGVHILPGRVDLMIQFKDACVSHKNQPDKLAKQTKFDRVSMKALPLIWKNPAK